MRDYLRKMLNLPHDKIGKPKIKNKEDYRIIKIVKILLGNFTRNL